MGQARGDIQDIVYEDSSDEDEDDGDAAERKATAKGGLFGMFKGLVGQKVSCGRLPNNLHRCYNISIKPFATNLIQNSYSKRAYILYYERHVLGTAVLHIVSDILTVLVVNCVLGKGAD